MSFDNVYMNAFHLYYLTLKETLMTCHVFYGTLQLTWSLPRRKLSCFYNDTSGMWTMNH